MRGYISALSEIEEDFLETLITRLGFIISLILVVGFSLLVYDKYSLFMTLLPLIVLVTLLYITYILIKNKFSLSLDFKRNKTSYYVSLIVLLLCLLNILFFHERWIIHGYDPGMYAQIGAYLVEHETHFIKDRFAKTFSGVLEKNGRLVHGISPLYPVYLSMFFKYFSLTGFALGNSILHFVGIMTVFFILKKIKSERSGIFFVIFFTLNYYTLYFSRSTWGENLLFFLLWSGVYQFLKGIQSNRLDNCLYAGLPISLLLVTRSEGIAYVMVYILAFLYHVILKRLRFASIASVLVLVLLIFVVHLKLTYNEQIMDNTSKLAKFASNRVLERTVDITSHGKKFNEQIFIFYYLYSIFNPVGLVLMGLLGTLNIFKESRQLRRFIFWIIILILPGIGFLYRPMVAMWIPWAMRRYWGVVIPLVIMLFSIFAQGSLIKSKRILSAIVSFMPALQT